MSAVHSARWYRVADLKPRLDSALQLRRQRLRGETWYVLAEPGGQRHVRLNRAAWAIAGRLDGRRSVQQLWDERLAAGDDPPTQDEVIELLAQLREAALVQFDRAGDTPLWLAHLDSVQHPRQRNSLLAWRLRLADPSALLDRLVPLGRVLFSRGAAWVWAAAAAALLLLALEHAPTLVAHARQSLATPRYAALALLLYAPIKLLHELAHGLAVRRWGGAVRQAGVTLMLGLPVPWVDASAASAFAQRHRRVVVGAAGMMAELALAALALPLWLALPDGLARDAAFVTLCIAGASTLLFNANPLQRLDGYFIATDALALPNLAPRSRQWWLERLRGRVLRVPDAASLAPAPGETPWLAAYAPLAWLYGVAIAALAVAWLGQISFALGLGAGLLLGWQTALRPAAALWRSLRSAALAQQGTARRWQRLVLGGAALLVALLLVPLPQRTRVQGVVWPPDAAQLRADEDGFVAELLVRDGAPVGAGTPVLRLANPALQAQLVRQGARVEALEAQLVQTQATGADASIGDGRNGDAQAELASAQVALGRLRERVAALTVTAQLDGTLALPQGADLAGSYLRRGTLFGQVLDGAAPTVRVALPESEVGELARDGGAVEVRLAGSAAHAHPARLLRDGAGAVRQLPSAALSQRQGGPVATDPADPHDLRALQPVVLLDVRLDDAAGAPARLGERAAVRFDAGWAPLAWQLAHGLRRALERRFNPQF